MSQNNFVIANQGFPATRADLTDAFQAVVSNNSGSTQPPLLYPNMMWYDTFANILKMRSEADDAWISIGYLDQSTNVFKILDDTVVTTADGLTAAGLLGDQTTGTWETGTGTTESLVSPAKVKAAIASNAQSTSSGAIGTYVTALYQGAVSFGSTYAGSSLLVASTANSVAQSSSGESFSGGAAGSLSGTWRAMCRGTGQANRFPTGSFVRIS